MGVDSAAWSDPAAEERLRAEVGLEEPWAFVELCTTLTRLSGSADERRAFDHLAGRLAAWGIRHELHEPELFVSWPVSAAATLRLPDGTAHRFPAKTPSMSVSTGDDPVQGPAAHLAGSYARGVDDLFASAVGAGGAADVAGKVVVTEGLPMPAKVADLERFGAIAAVFVSPGERIHEGICTTIWGSPDLDAAGRQPGIPVAEVSRADGAALIAAIRGAGGTARLAVATELETTWRPIPILVAEIPGTEAPDRFVLVHGHVDSWHVGIGDNATGDATLLELARVFARHPPRRTLRVAWWSGHSHGRYAGSTWYADTFALDLIERCVAHLNCDSPGCRWASTFNHLSATEETWPLAEAAIRDVAGAQMPVTWDRPPRAGDYSFMNLGLSAAFMLSSTMPDDLRAERSFYAVGGCGGNIAWHTEDDTIEIADRDNLLRDIRVYATAAGRLLNAPILPLDFRRAAAGLEATLTRYQAAAGGRFDLAPGREALGALRTALDGFYGAVTAGRVDAARANEALLRLSRLLVPLNYARRGRFEQDPAADVPPLPDLAPALTLPNLTPGSHQDRVTRQSLVRGQNRLVWTLREAVRTVEGEGGGRAS